jgi:carbonic anhydrase/acetyltransferase-like protein (isoleucine patch superfamily)
MSIYKLGEDAPVVAASAYVAPNAAVVGKVILGERSSVWFGAALRGDNELIRIGAGSNVQDSAVLHTDMGFPLTVGDEVSIGHQAAIHGCTIGDGTLIGIQAIVMNGAVIGKACLVGAGALITEGKEFADGSLIVGVPAKTVRQLSAAEREKLLQAAAIYAARAVLYRNQLQTI